MEAAPAPALNEQMRTLFDRTMKRGIKGLEYFGSPAPEIGVTPRDLIYQEGTYRLFHYRPLAEEIYRVPLLMVMATTNRGSLFDLAPGQSFVEFMMLAGYDVYVIDWEAPRAHESHLDLSSYVDGFVADAVERVANHSRVPEVTLVGYCMGGILALIYQALNPQGAVRNLITFTVPVDGSKVALFNAWTDRRYFDVDRLVEALGNVPGDLIFTSFSMLKPSSDTASTLRLWDNMWNDRFVESYRKMDRWLADPLPLAGEYFRDTTKKLMWENGFMTGKLEIKGRKVDLGSITVPFLHVVAEHDHIVPYEASKPLVEMIGSPDKHEVVLKGGHVGLVAGGNAKKRLWPQLDQWLQERSL